MRKRMWQGIILSGSMVLLLVCSAAAAEAVRQGLLLCARSVVPALFPYFVVSGLFTSLGFAESAGRRLAPVTERLLGVGGEPPRFFWGFWAATLWGDAPWASFTGRVG